MSLELQPTSERSILCVQLEHFYARVALARAADETLADKPVAVTRNGRVLDSSPAAAAAGLRPGLRVREVRRWFPEAVFVPAAAEDEYPEYARPALDLCAGYTPLVEPETPARIFLDVTGCAALHGSESAIANELARRLPVETGFSCVVGGGRNRLVARLAAPRRRLVPPGEEREFLAPLPLSLLGDTLDAETMEWLQLRGVSSLGEVAKLPEGALWRRFGVEGEKLRRLALGQDSTPVRPVYPPRSLEARRLFDSPVETEQEMTQYLSHLAGEIAARLAETREAARRYRLALLLSGGDAVVAALRLPAPIGSLLALCEVFLRLFRKLAPPEPPVGVVVTAEEITAGEAFQGSLFPEMEGAAALRQRERERRLGHTLQQLSLRFGPKVVIPGCHLWVIRRPRFSERVGEWS